MSPYNILYVDDEPDLLELCKVYLEDTGIFSVHLTESGSDAIRLVSQGSIDAIISDYQMPLMDGITFVKEIRKQGILIPFIIFTGRGREEVVIEALNAGVDFYIQKGGDPVSQFAELAYKVKRAIEQRRSVEALMESKSLYQLLADHITDTVWLMDMNLQITYSSPSIIKLRGFSQSELKSLPLDKHLTPPSLKIAQDIFKEEMEKVIGSQYYNFERTLELEFYRKDGSTYWSENTFTLIRDDNKMPVSILGEGRDITKRKYAEDLLAKSEQKYRELVENISDVIYEIDSAGRIKYISPAVSNVLQFTPDDFIGKNFIDFIYPQDKELLLKEFKELTKGVEYPLDYRVKTKSGGFRWVRTQTKPIIEDGRFVGARGTLIDVNERRQAEENLRVQYETSLHLNNCYDLNTAFEVLLSGIKKIDGLDFNCLYFYDKLKEEAIIKDEYGSSLEFSKEIQPLKNDNVIIREALEGRALYTSKYESDWLKVKNYFPNINLMAFATIPIYDKGELIAIIISGSSSLNSIPVPTRNMFKIFSMHIENIILRIHSADKLHETEELNQQLLENYPGDIILSRKNGEIISVNQALINELGYNQGEIINTSLRLFVPVEDHGHLRAILESGEDEKFNLPQDINLLSKSGEKKPVTVRRIIGNRNNYQVVLLLIDR